MRAPGWSRAIRQRATPLLREATPQAIVATVAMLLPSGAAMAVAAQESRPVLPTAPAQQLTLSESAQSGTAYEEAASATLPPTLVRTDLMFTAVTAAGAVVARAPTPTMTAVAVPSRVYAAYRLAAASLARTDPSCRLPWSLLAGIGQVESGHAGGGQVDATGRTLTPIIGLPLDGSRGTARIADTDAGAFDGDAVWDHAVGPMQFIPGTWRYAGADGNADGVRDPHNVYDAALASAGYLCASGGDLRNAASLRSALLSYNQSESYVQLVVAYATAFATGRPAVLPTVVSADVAPPAPTPTPTPKPTPSPRPTQAAPATATSTPTRPKPSPKASPKPTATASTASATQTTSPTSTQTATATATSTPAPTATPTLTQ